MKWKLIIEGPNNDSVTLTNKSPREDVLTEVQAELDCFNDERDEQSHWQSFTLTCTTS